MSADVFGYVASGMAGTLLLLTVYLVYKLITVYDENTTLRDRHDGDLVQFDELKADRDALSVQVATLKPALNTSERLLVAANALISQLRDEKAALQKDRIDEVPASDLVQLSHELLRPPPAPDPAGTGDDHGSTGAVPRPVTP